MGGSKRSRNQRAKRASSRKGGAGRVGGEKVDAPSGQALEFRLVAEPEFHEAVMEMECPVKVVTDVDDSAEGLPHQMVHEFEGSARPGLSERKPVRAGGRKPLAIDLTERKPESWNKLASVIAWFAVGAAADTTAELRFSPLLTKEQRAVVHQLVEGSASQALDTSSRGLGDDRYIALVRKGQAKKHQEALDATQQRKAYFLWNWAREDGVSISRDEVAERVGSNNIGPELEAVWERRAAFQKLTAQLCEASAGEDLQPLTRLLAGDGAFKLLSGLPIDAAPVDVVSGASPLHVAAENGRAKAVTALLAARVPVDARDGWNQTALQVARRAEQCDIEGLLLQAGAVDPDNGRTILDAAPRALRGTSATSSMPKGGGKADGQTEPAPTARVASKVASNATTAPAEGSTPATTPSADATSAPHEEVTSAGLAPAKPATTEAAHATSAPAAVPASDDEAPGDSIFGQPIASHAISSFPVSLADMSMHSGDLSVDGNEVTPDASGGAAAGAGGSPEARHGRHEKHHDKHQPHARQSWSHNDGRHLRSSMSQKGRTLDKRLSVTFSETASEIEFEDETSLSSWLDKDAWNVWATENSYVIAGGAVALTAVIGMAALALRRR